MSFCFSPMRRRGGARRLLIKETSGSQRRLKDAGRLLQLFYIAPQSAPVGISYIIHNQAFKLEITMAVHFHTTNTGKWNKWSVLILDYNCFSLLTYMQNTSCVTLKVVQSKKEKKNIPHTIITFIPSRCIFQEGSNILLVQHTAALMRAMMTYNSSEMESKEVLCTRFVRWIAARVMDSSLTRRNTAVGI